MTSNVPVKYYASAQMATTRNSSFSSSNSLSQDESQTINHDYDERDGKQVVASSSRGAGYSYNYNSGLGIISGRGAHTRPNRLSHASNSGNNDITALNSGIKVASRRESTKNTGKFGYSYYSSSTSDYDSGIDVNNEESYYDFNRSHVIRRKSSASAINLESNLNVENSLDSSEWVLFSPSHSLVTENRNVDPSYIDDDDDVLSSAMTKSKGQVEVDKDADYSDGEAEADEGYYYEEEEGEEEEDELIDDINEISKGELSNARDDLSQRIEKWRRQQFNLFLNDITNDTGDLDNLNGLNLEKLDSNTIDLIKAWGIDNSNSNSGRTSPLMTGLRVNGGKRNNTLKSTFYGDEIFSKYSDEDIRIIKKVLNKLSHSLVNVKDHRNSPRIPRTKSKSSTNLRDASSSYQMKRSNSDSSAKFLNNKKLQKFMPIYLKTHIVDSNLLDAFENEQSVTDMEDGSINRGDEEAEEEEEEEEEDDEDEEEGDDEEEDVKTLPGSPRLQDVVNFPKDGRAVGYRYGYGLSRKESVISNLYSDSFSISNDNDNDNNTNLAANTTNTNTTGSDIHSLNSNSILTYSTGSILGF